MPSTHLAYTIEGTDCRVEIKFFSLEFNVKEEKPKYEPPDVKDLNPSQAELTVEELEKVAGGSSTDDCNTGGSAHVCSTGGNPWG